jgi:hypothetical protein
MTDALVTALARFRHLRGERVFYDVGQSWGNQDALEMALAKALEGATAAGQFDVVALLAGELQARRLAREGLAKPDAKKRRGGA